jgi:hypothetical protein
LLQLCKHSEEWAKRLASRGHLEHRQNSDYGENIFCSWSSIPSYRVTGREPVDNWYSEIKDHPFGREPRTLKSGKLIALLVDIYLLWILSFCLTSFTFNTLMPTLNIS